MKSCEYKLKVEAAAVTAEIQNRYMVVK